VRGAGSSERGPVLLVHGAGVRANIFRPPVETTIVDYLADRGYDVWLENWRASIDVAPNHWDLEQAAVHDHPAAVAKVLEETGATELKAIIHCQGSTSFMMSLVAGLVPEVTTVVSNAVALHPIVARFSRLKIEASLPILHRFVDHLDPQWGIAAPDGAPRFLSLLVNAVHHECDNAVCKQVSFTYGSGFPALWRHENLNTATHEWLKQEFGFVPLTFFDGMARCVRKGRLVAEHFDTLPRDFCAQSPETDARFAFFAGARNRCFLPRSQVETFRHFDAWRPGFHSLHVLPGYSHLDVFLGKEAHRDVFPLMAAALERDPV
jgi:pimeloyl-ACP methyl ester carboxylesterase